MAHSTTFLLLLSFLMASFHAGLTETINLSNVLKTNKRAADPPPRFCPFHPEPVPLPSPLPGAISDALTNLTSMVKLVINESSVPGLAAAVAYRGQTILAVGSGVVDKHSKSPKVPDGDTIFRIGSISKVFVVLTLFHLIEEGHVKSWDDPITDYCPKFSIKNSYDIENVVTLRQMVSELSGLPDQPPCFGDLEKNLCPSTTDDILSKLKDQYLVMTSWTRPSYSNLAFALLGRCLMEKFRFTSYEKYVEKYILEPLKMTSTGFDITNSVKSRMATGYNTDGSVASLYDLGWAAPAGQMYSTVNDLMKLAQFLNSFGKDGGILSAESIKQMLLPAFLDYDGVTVWGSPWEMVFQDTYLIRSKGGQISGYTGFMTFQPELQLSYVILINGNPSTIGLLSYPYDILIRAFAPVLTGLQPKHPAPPNPEAYVGSYKDKATQSNYTVFQYEGQLALQTSPSIALFLSYYDKLLFQLKEPPLVPCVAFEVTGANNEWLYFEEIDEKTGKSPGFTFPGLFGLDTFTRIE